MKKTKRAHWIESYAKRGYQQSVQLRSDNAKYHEYISKLRLLGLSTQDIADMYNGLSIAHSFIEDGRQIFMFDPDAAALIGKTEGLPDLRTVLDSVPYSSFAVDLGNGKGFFFMTAPNMGITSSEEALGTDTRDDEVFCFDRPNVYKDKEGREMFFDWIPCAKDKEKMPEDGRTMHQILNSQDEAEYLALEVVENTVAYLCCANAEITTVYRPAPKRKARRESRATWHEVGFRIGAELRAYERSRNNGGRSDSGTVRPHVRRAHWHRYWTGPMNGERRLVLKWVAPTMVGTANGEIESATGHRVPA